MKKYNQFITQTNELDEGLGTLAKVAVKGGLKLAKKTPIFKKAGKVIKNLISKPKPKPSDYIRMYHGTTEKAAKNILKKGMRGSSKNPVSRGVYDNSAFFRRKGFVTNDPEIARQYTMQHEYMGKKPDIVALKVLKKNLKRGTNPGEFTAPVKDIKPVARGVKPIETRKGQVMQDEFTYKTFKQFMEQVSPKHYDKIPVTIDDAITNRIRTLDTIDKSNKKFRKGTGFNLPLPLAKKKNNKKVQTA